MNERNEAMDMLLQAINDIKKTGFTSDSVDGGFYLGGDLGIDSREMLEIWYELEQRLGVRVDDSEKRDLYTLSDVVSLLEAKLEQAGAPEVALH